MSPIYHHPTANRGGGNSFWGTATAEIFFPLLQRMLWETVQHPQILKMGSVVSGALTGHELCSTPPPLLRTGGDPVAVITVVRTEWDVWSRTCLGYWRRTSSCEDGGRNPLIKVKLKIFNMLFTLNFFLFLEGCDQIKAIILLNDLKISMKVWKKIALIKLLQRLKQFTIILSLILHKTSIIITNL